MTQLETLIEAIPKYQPGADLDVLARAYHFSAASHQGQHRASGEPYLSHPLEVATLLVDFKMDVTTVTAALLHDVLEDTTATKADLEREFGGEIAELVDGVTKIGKLAFSSREERQGENFRKMLVAMARDLRVLMIKLADRLHNMRTLDYLSPDRAKKIAQETLDIYAPLAHRLGMAKVKAELEDLALRSLSPGDYVDLQKRVAKRRLEREADINQVIAILQRKLAEVGIDSQIRGRPKHFYSIWKKMHDQGREFDEIYDLTAVRVITASVRDCYGALGVIHSLWKPVPGRFKDFIAMPKAKLYQSLHTTGLRPKGPRGDPLPLDARAGTLQGLHRDAEGQHVPVAAHDGDRAQGRPGGDPDPHPRDAPHRRGRYRGPLALQGAQGGQGQARRVARVAASADRDAAGHQGPARVHGHRAGRSVPGRGVRLHAQGRREGASGRRDAARFRLRRAHEGPRALRRREGERQARTPPVHLTARGHRRDRHLAQPAPEPCLAEDRT